MTLTAAPTISNDASAYLNDVWRDQPCRAAATDQAYVKWEASWDQLATDAEAGIPAAVEAVDVINNEVEAAIRRLRAEARP